MIKILSGIEDLKPLVQFSFPYPQHYTTIVKPQGEKNRNFMLFFPDFKFEIIRDLNRWVSTVPWRPKIGVGYSCSSFINHFNTMYVGIKVVYGKLLVVLAVFIRFLSAWNNQNNTLRRDDTALVFSRNFPILLSKYLIFKKG